MAAQRHCFTGRQSRLSSASEHSPPEQEPEERIRPHPHDARLRRQLQEIVVGAFRLLVFGRLGHGVIVGEVVQTDAKKRTLGEDGRRGAPIAVTHLRRADVIPHGD